MRTGEQAAGFLLAIRDAIPRVWVAHTKAMMRESKAGFEVQDDRQWALRACGNGEGAPVGRAESGSFPVGKECG